MTLLSEALAERKQALTDISTLSARAQEAAVKYADDEDDGELNAKAVLEALDAAVARFEDLSVQVNKTNNVTEVAFEGRTMSLMEAIAHREALLFTAKHYRALADHMSETLYGKPSRYSYATKRTKDDVKQVATVKVDEVRAKADATSQTVRRLDLAIQQKNWTTDLV